MARAASSFNLAISDLLLTTDLEGKDEHILAFESYFVRSHRLQMQRGFFGFFFGPWGGKKKPSFIMCL